MKFNFLFLIILGIVSCEQHSIPDQNLLYGEWHSKNQTGLKLLFSDSDLKEVYPNRALLWRYDLKGDTLILSNDNAEIQKHIIETLTEKELKLIPEELNQVDIPLMNHVEFFKEP